MQTKHEELLCLFIIVMQNFKRLCVRQFGWRKIEVQISSLLIETFPSAQPVSVVPGDNTNLVQTTQVAESSRYYSILPVSANYAITKPAWPDR